MNRALEVRIRYGEIGEQRFEDFCNTNSIWFHRFGITTKEGYAMPKDMFYKIPKLIKSAPDYLMIKNKFHFVECKMADKHSGNHVKIKEHDMKHYTSWASVGDLLFFIHNRLTRESFIVEYHYVSDLIANSEYEQGMYPENGKYFWKVKMDDIRRIGREV